MENRVLGKSIAVLHRREQKYMIQKMKEIGIGYSSYNFLIYLSVNPGSSQKEMCRGMAVDEALAARTMKKLEEKGFVMRKKSEENGRSYEIYLTEQGEEVIPRLRGFLAQWWSQVISVLPEKEQEMMIKNIEIMAVQSKEVLERAVEKKTTNRKDV